MLGLTCVLAPGTASVVEACSCARGPVRHPCQSYSDRSVVFLGRAVDVQTVQYGREGWHRRVYTFTVEEPFAGVTEPTVEIATGMGGGDCGVYFEVGVPAFVHAWTSNAGHEIEVGLCGTRSTRDLGSPDVDYGRALAAGDPGVAIFGRVTTKPPEGSHSSLAGEGLEGVTISAHGPDGHSLWTTTAPDGRFEFPGPLRGRYTVRAEQPGDVGPLSEQEVEVVGERCQGLEFVVGPSEP